jgi:hypothetical protein
MQLQVWSLLLKNTKLCFSGIYRRSLRDKRSALTRARFGADIAQNQALVKSLTMGIYVNPTRSKK